MNIKKLKGEDRWAYVMLKQNEGHDLTEISEDLGITVDTLYVWIHRNKSKFKFFNKDYIILLENANFRISENKVADKIILLYKFDGQSIKFPTDRYSDLIDLCTALDYIDRRHN